MSNKNNRYFKCEGESFDLLCRYKRQLDSMALAHVRLQKEMAERQRKSNEHFSSILNTIWERMTALIGLVPKVSWGNPEYQLETRYIDDGFGAILYNPSDGSNTIGALLGIEDDRSDKKTDPRTSVPPKNVTRH